MVCPTPDRDDEKGEICHHLTPTHIHIIIQQHKTCNKKNISEQIITPSLYFMSPIGSAVLFFNNWPRICEPRGHVLGRCRSQQFGRLLRLRHSADDLQRSWPRIRWTFVTGEGKKFVTQTGGRICLSFQTKQT